MIFFLAILIFVIFVGINFCNEGEFHTDYCSPKQTSTINGIFTLLIFLSHATQYISLSGPLDSPYKIFRKYMGQLVVATFLFYSGFGMMESIKKKGMLYIKSIPTKRFFRVWYHFAIALIPFIILNFVFHKEYEIKNILLAFTGYKAIGNSNWYMFITFAMYIIIYIAFMIARKHNTLGIAIVFGLAIGFAIFEQRIGLPDRYYNTLFCLPMGMAFSQVKPIFDRIVMKNDILYLFSFAGIFVVYYYFYSNRDDSIVYYNIFAILAVMMIMMLNMKVKIGNKALDFFGRHIFSIFFLQRIPMIALKELGYSNHKYSFIVVSLTITICLAIVFDWCMDKTDKLIYNRKKDGQ